ncbi:MAG: DUF2007 domain-containing protein [Chitinophagaceae bacterium]|nr:MAG: DUF2007 domain-containing protein [Chitinophagaceae bacterium]
MNEGWTKIFTTEDAIEAEILKQGLMENDIIAVTMNKQDSPHKMFGVISVMVPAEDAERAVQYLTDNGIK